MSNFLIDLRVVVFEDIVGLIVVAADMVNVAIPVAFACWVFRTFVHGTL